MKNKGITITMTREEARIISYALSICHEHCGGDDLLAVCKKYEKLLNEKVKNNK